MSGNLTLLGKRLVVLQETGTIKWIVDLEEGNDATIWLADL